MGNCAPKRCRIVVVVLPLFYNSGPGNTSQVNQALRTFLYEGRRQCCCPLMTLKCLLFLGLGDSLLHLTNSCNKTDEFCLLTKPGCS